MRKRDIAYWDSIKDTHVGERAFVLATGPGLRWQPIHLLEGEYTVGVNHLMLWKDLPFIPTAWAQSEGQGRDRVSKEVAHLKIEKWMADTAAPAEDMTDDWHWIFREPRISLAKDHHRDWENAPDALGLGDEFWRVANSYGPVGDCAVPVLVWMGFTHIYLCGLDNTVDNHVYGDPLVLQEGNRRPEGIHRAFKNMQTILKPAGRYLINTTPSNRLPMPYRPLEEVMDEEPVGAV